MFQFNVSNRASAQIFLAIVLIAGFAVLTPYARGPVEDGLDVFVFTELVRMRSPMLTIVLSWLTHLGSTPLTMFISLMMFIPSLKLDRTVGVRMFAATIGASLWTEVLKRLFARPRPSVLEPLIQVSGDSYPSGHAFTAAATYTTLAILLSRRSTSKGQRVWVWIIAAAVIGIVAFSRVYLGVHYFTDVVGGTLLGVAWACVVTTTNVRPNQGREVGRA